VRLAAVDAARKANTGRSHRRVFLVMVDRKMLASGDRA